MKVRSRSLVLVGRLVTDHLVCEFRKSPQAPDRIVVAHGPRTGPRSERDPDCWVMVKDLAGGRRQWRSLVARGYRVSK